MKPIVLNLMAAIGLSAALAACVPAADSAPSPTPAPTRPAPPPAPPPQEPAYSSWMDQPATPGNWSYAPQTNGGMARFDGAQGADFSLSCTRSDGQILLSRSGAASSAVPMRIRTEFGDRVFTASPQGSNHHALAASLPASDRFFDSMALTKGRFAVEISGLSTLYLPAWGEVTRVIEDCR